jgi:hypothetical protein
MLKKFSNLIFRLFILTMIKEINNMFSLELSSTLCFDRRFEAADELFDDDSRTRVILVGASHLQYRGYRNTWTVKNGGLWI